MRQYLTKRNIFLLIITTIVLLSLLLITFGNSNNDAIKPQEKAWRVAAIKATPGRYAPNIILFGQIETPRTTELKSPLATHVKKVLVLEGEKAKKKQLLILLDDREARLTLTQRQAEIKELQAKIQAEKNRYANDQKAVAHEKELVNLRQKALERQRHLLKTKVSSQEAFDKANEALQEQQLTLTTRELALADHESRLNQLHAQLNQAQAAQGDAELDLERTQIRAPFSGRISKLTVSPGDWVQAGEILTEIFDTQALEVRAQIPSQYLALIQKLLKNKQNLTATMIVDKQSVKLRLKRLAALVATGEGGVDGLFTVKKNGKQLALGRSVQLLLNLPKQDNLYPIPRQALYGKDKVYLVKDNRMQAIKVELVGLFHQENNSNQVLIRSNQIQAGDQIVTTQLPNARTGLLLQVVAP